MEGDHAPLQLDWVPDGRAEHQDGTSGADAVEPAAKARGEVPVLLFGLFEGLWEGASDDAGNLVEFASAVRVRDEAGVDVPFEVFVVHVLKPTVDFSAARVSREVEAFG